MEQTFLKDEFNQAKQAYAKLSAYNKRQVSEWNLEAWHTQFSYKFTND